MENYLQIKVEGQEGYLKAFLNNYKDKNSDPDYKGKGVVVWVNQAKTDKEDQEQAKPKVQATRV